MRALQGSLHALRGMPFFFRALAQGGALVLRGQVIPLGAGFRLLHRACGAEAHGDDLLRPDGNAVPPGGGERHAAAARHVRQRGGGMRQAQGDLRRPARPEMVARRHRPRRHPARRCNRRLNPGWAVC